MVLVSETSLTSDSGRPTVLTGAEQISVGHMTLQVTFAEHSSITAAPEPMTSSEQQITCVVRVCRQMLDVSLRLLHICAVEPFSQWALRLLCVDYSDIL